VEVVLVAAAAAAVVAAQWVAGPAPACQPAGVIPAAAAVVRRGRD